MAALSPNRKLRTEFSFMRHNGNQEAISQTPSPASTSTSVLTTESLLVPETPGRSRTRLPTFLNRSRKKSTQRGEEVEQQRDERCVLDYLAVKYVLNAQY